MKLFERPVRKLAFIMLAAVVSSVAYMPVSFAEKHMGHQQKKEEMVTEFYDAVDATPEQRQELDSIHKEYRAKMEPLEKSMWQQKHDLMVYIAQPDSNQRKANRMESDIIRLKSQLGDLHIEKAFKSKAVLKPEQQQKAVDFIQKKKEKWKKDAPGSSSDASGDSHEEQPELRG